MIALLPISVKLCADRSLENKLITYVSVAEKCYPGVLMKNFVLTGIFMAGFMSILGYFVVLADEIPTLLERVRGVRTFQRGLMCMCACVVRICISVFGVFHLLMESSCEHFCGYN